MPILTVSYSKLLTQRLESKEGKNLSINNNISIKDIIKSDINLGEAKQPGLRFTFEFSSKYEPKYAEIIITGDVIYYSTQARVDEVLKEWKKDKTAPKDISAEVINHLLSRCNIQALLLSREMGLPSPIPLPKVSAK